MTDYKKLFYGLECCSTNRLRRPDCEEMNCSYLDLYDHGCVHQLIRDAFAWIKAQEPRVMTLEEYDAWTDIPFTERDPVFHEERTKRGSVTCWVNTCVCSLREYGKNDRFWTSRPSKEELEATPWN